MNRLYEYKAKSKSEIRFIERHFYVYYKDDSYRIFYSTTDKIIRKLKILSIDNVKLYENLKRIIDKSITPDIQEMLSNHVSLEIAKEIDRNIISDLMKMFNPRKTLTKKFRYFIFSEKKKKNTYNTKKYKKSRIYKKVIN